MQGANKIQLYYYTAEYGPDLEKVSSRYDKTYHIEYEKFQWGDYEEKTTDGVTTSFYFVNGTDGLAGLHTVSSTQGGTVTHSAAAITDHLGTITAMVDNNDWCYDVHYDVWGNRVISMPFYYSIERGFTGHDHIDGIGLIDMRGRMYDPHLGRFLSPDAFVQAPTNPQNYNRYSYCLNNPLKYTDPDGELFWEAVLIGAAIFGAGNTIAHGIRGDINGLEDGIFYFAQGALAGAALGATWYLAPSIPVVGNAIQSYMTWSFECKLTMTAVSAVSGVARGLCTKDWNGLLNSAELFLGNLYIDENTGFFEGVWQGYSRHSWESLQTGLGHSYNQIRNFLWSVDRVDYMAGATYATNEYKNGGSMSLGNFIKTNISDKIDSDFETWILSHPTYMHEYGHTLDSHRFGPAYLLAIGVPSLLSAAFSQQIKNEPDGVTTHSFFWTEMRANVNAKQYFGNKYGISWEHQNYKKYKHQSNLFTIETFYPTIKR